MNTDPSHEYPATDYSFFSPYTTRYDRPDPVGSVLEDWDDDDEDDDYTDEGQFNF